MVLWVGNGIHMEISIGTWLTHSVICDMYVTYYLTVVKLICKANTLIHDVCIKAGVIYYNIIENICLEYIKCDRSTLQCIFLQL